jgi:hypothetical protein
MNDKLNQIVLSVLDEFLSKEQLTDSILLDLTKVIRAISKKIITNLSEIEKSLEYCYNLYRNNRWGVKVLENNLVQFLPCGNKVRNN